MSQRTNQQNKSLHKLFTLVAEQLDSKGITAVDVVKALMEHLNQEDLLVSSGLVKELVWKSFQRVRLGKDSTTELTSQEIDKIYDEVNLYLGENFHIHIPFPSNENLNDNTI